MADFAEYKDKSINFVKGLSAAKRLTIVSLAVLFVLAAVLMVSWATKRDYTILYKDLSAADAGIVLRYIKDSKIPYQVTGGGNTILVPTDKVYDIRMELAAQNLPQGGGVGFELFDNTKLGMTEFMQNVNYQRALQGELARTISSFPEVKSARVHIVIPEKSLFIEDEKPATASIVLDMTDKTSMKQSQVDGIVHLVSSSIKGLTPENVTVVDSSGNMLAGPGVKRETLGDITNEQLAFQHKIEKELQRRITAMLEKVLGRDNFIVSLACDVDYKKLEKTEELFSPDNKAVVSEQVFELSGVNADVIGGFADEPSPLSTSLSPTLNNDNNLYKRKDQTTNYEVGKVLSKTIEPIGQVSRVSVAVIVDGIRKFEKVPTNTDVSEESSGAASARRSARQKSDAKQEGFVEEWTYTPRSQEDIDKIASVVKRVVNYNELRGDVVDVVNIPFESFVAPSTGVTGVVGKTIDIVKEQSHLIKYLIVAAFILLCFLFIVRPLVRWITGATEQEGDLLKQLPKTVGEIERELGVGQRLPLRDRAMQQLMGDPERMAKVLTLWLNEDQNSTAQNV